MEAAAGERCLKEAFRRVAQCSNGLCGKGKEPQSNAQYYQSEIEMVGQEKLHKPHFITH